MSARQQQYSPGLLHTPLPTQLACAHLASQRSLHNAPIFRLLLKVAVNGTHQCDFLNFCGPLAATSREALKQTWTAGRRCFACFAKLLAHFSLCRVAQLGEHHTEDLKVPDSIPGLSIISDVTGCRSDRQNWMTTRKLGKFGFLSAISFCLGQTPSA